MTHKFVPSRIGHGNYQCEHCLATDLELGAMGKLGHCEHAPPGVTVQIVGKPLTEDLLLVFGAWGVAKSIVVSDQTGIVVGYRDGTTMKFVPVGEP